LVKSQSAFTIISSAGPGGMIAHFGNVRVGKGALQEFIISPNAGYKINSIKADGVEVVWTIQGKE